LGEIMLDACDELYVTVLRIKRCPEVLSDVTINQQETVMKISGFPTLKPADELSRQTRTRTRARTRATAAASGRGK
jgi:hypothetical protein